MAETTVFTSTQLKQWLEKETNSTLTPVQTQAKKQRDEMKKSLENLNDVCESLIESSASEIEKRNMKVYNRARALNKLARLFLDRLKKLNPPEQVTYDSLSRYVQETQKILLVTDIDIKNWFPRISPFFIMDRRKFLSIYERAKQAYTSLNDYVSKEYIKTKTLEEALLLISELQGQERQLLIFKDEKTTIINERLPIEQEIKVLEEKINELKCKGPVDKLNMVNCEIDSLSNELKHELRHMQKPFIKMQALATGGGGGGITPDELNKITQYLETPFNAFVSEKADYPLLKEILQKLEELIAQDKLKLKPEKARKAEQSINEILRKDSLAKLQIRCVEMATNKEQLLASSKMDEINQNIVQYQAQADLLKARKTSVETHETVKENAYKETEDKIGSLKRTIERNVYNSINKKIQIA